jgi:5-methylcytosine-specific restriction enzyme subunit McrC
VTAVGDTKWTRVEPGAQGWLMPSEAHVYQMNAYASVYPCDDFALLYPRHEGLSQAHATAFRLPGHGERKAKLHVVCIDAGNDLFPVRIGGDGSRFAELLRNEVSVN